MKDSTVPDFNVIPTKEQVLKLAEKYVADAKNQFRKSDDGSAINLWWLEQRILGVRAQVQGQGYISTKNRFLEVCYWKTPRSKKHCEKNSEELIVEVSRIAFSSKLEEVRIKSWMMLQGVQWPTASVFLHLFHRDQYPILDVRALEALGSKRPAAYTLEFWNSYVSYMRNLAKSLNLDMRTLDRGLWQWSADRAKEGKPE